MFAEQLDPERFDVSQLIRAKDFDELEKLRANARDVAIEGIMLKRRESAYVGGRRSGLWYKWKRDPLTADCVLMYAQRGSGKRSSYYSDYTFGCWTEEGELLPVGRRISASPTRNCAGSTAGSAATRSSASVRCAKSRRASCSKSPSIRSTGARATNPASRCVSRGSAAFGSTNRRLRPTEWRHSRRW